MNYLTGLGVVVLIVISSVLANSRHLATYCQELQQSGREPRACLDYLCRGRTLDGVYNIYPTGFSDFSIPVYCDQTTDGGGWTVFQRRMDGSVEFFRNWANYKLGFGEARAEHWLGNDNLHVLTNLYRNNQLRIDLESSDNDRAFAQYGNFSIAAEADSYRMSVNNYLNSSTVTGDSMANANGQRFSTKDRDQDTWSSSSCATTYKGAWWYNKCHSANLNGFYYGGPHESYADGVNWNQWKTYYNSLTKTEMKFRPAY